MKIGTITYQDNPEMDDELPILKGILNGEVKYHNARRYLPKCLQVLTCSEQFRRFNLLVVYDNSYVSFQVRFCPQPRTPNDGGCSSMNEWVRRFVNGICCLVSTKTCISIQLELFGCYVTSDVKQIGCPNVK